MVDSATKTAPEYLAEIKNINDKNTKINQIESLLTKYPRFISAWLELGLLYRQQSDRVKAWETFKQALEIKPNHQKLKLELSTEQLYLEKLDDCRQNLVELLQLEPKHRPGIINLSKLYQKENNLAGAVELLYIALKDYPNNFQLLLQIGQLERKRQNFEQALIYLEQAINKGPQKIQAHLTYIDTLLDLSRFEAAQNKLKILQEKYPDNFQILIRAGNLDRNRGQREKALFWFEIALNKALSPAQNLKASTLIVKELLALGRLDLAVAKIDLFISEPPDNIPLRIIKAKILTKQNKLIEAANIYKNNIQLESKNLESRLELANIYSQVGKVEAAISLLQETEQLLGQSLKLSLQLGKLYQDQSEYNQARYWYQRACTEYPEKPQGYCSLANLMVLEGNIANAIKLLQQTKAKIPHSPQVSLRIIQLQIQLGNFDLSQQILNQELILSPHNPQLLWQLCQIQIKQGKYELALKVLDRISNDDQESIKRTEQLKAIIYLWQGDFPSAETYLNQVIAKSAIATSDRDRLAIVLGLTGRVEAAQDQLNIATEELCIQPVSNTVNLPHRSITGMMVNELRTNPPMLKKLQATLETTGHHRILALANLLTQEPMYLGTALYLAKELRAQGVFTKMHQALSPSSSKTPSIPRRIVQFWDESQPPEEVQKICQSWCHHNPNYEHTIFSLDKAIAFLQKHYDSRVLQAFNNCHHAATKSDFFRLAYLNRMGGFYADVDDKCLQPLDSLISSNPELVVAQGLRTNIENDFLGCIPGQVMIRTAFNQAVESLIDYCNESPWFKTGPGLVTSAICGGLVPYLTCPDYSDLPRILVLNQSQLRHTVHQHLPLNYKKTNKSWNHEAKRKIKFAFSHKI